MGTSGEFKFEKFESKDLAEIIEFQKKAYIDQFNASDYTEDETIKRHFIWKYLDNPNCADGPFIWLARFKEKIIGQFCVMPHKVKIENNFYKAGWCQDFIVDPEFRNRGMGYFLIKHALNEASGYLDLLFVGGTNNASYPLFKTLGFIDIGMLPRYIKILRRSKKADSCGDDLINHALDYNEIWKRLEADKKCIFMRDKQNFKWRFVEQPWYDYKVFAATEGSKINGYIILRKGRIRNSRFKNLKIGIISDLFYAHNDKKTLNRLLNNAIRYFKAEGIDLVRLDILATQLDFALLYRGFIRVPSRNRFLFYVLNDDLKTKENLIRSKKNWFLTFFDSDFDLS